MTKSLLDPAFRYVPAARTDIRRTFARVRKEMAAEKARAQQSAVVPLIKREARK
jgi:hypothetical protein